MIIILPRKKKLVKEFKGQFNCPGENTEKYKTLRTLNTKKKLKELMKREKKLQKPYLTN